MLRIFSEKHILTSGRHRQVPARSGEIAQPSRPRPTNSNSTSQMCYRQIHLCPHSSFFSFDACSRAVALWLRAFRGIGHSLMGLPLPVRQQHGIGNIGFTTWYSPAILSAKIHLDYWHVRPFHVFEEFRAFLHSLVHTPADSTGGTMPPRPIMIENRQIHAVFVQRFHYQLIAGNQTDREYAGTELLLRYCDVRCKWLSEDIFVYSKFSGGWTGMDNNILCIIIFFRQR